ncbi:MAG: hypothetical protein V7K64_02395 [Nostoc sp.]|uniref:hypothetical protein n=1 Tax=unclassified Nostoc TaxID=2593658 RepID=UPI001DD0EEEF|nr:hypothetical protein [Nostoc sp. JL34]MBN3885613.1 hypothetical protein [Nostoc sp. JL34]
MLESWLGRTYAEIAVQISYKDDYIKQVGSQLWRSLSQAVGEDVCKKNIQSVLRRYQQSQSYEKSMSDRHYSYLSGNLIRYHAHESDESRILISTSPIIDSASAKAFAKSSIELFPALNLIVSAFKCLWA